MYAPCLSLKLENAKLISNDSNWSQDEMNKEQK